MEKIYTVAILGGGSRGSLFGRLMQQHGGYTIAAVCDTDPGQLEKCRTLMGLSP